MERENYLLHRARLILIELEEEYRRVNDVRTNHHINPEKDFFLNVIKSRMIEVESGIKILENIP